MNKWKKVQDLLEGERLAEDIADGKRVLFKKGEVLDKLKIDALLKMGIERVYVEAVDFYEYKDSDLEKKDIKLLLNHEIVEYAKKKIKNVIENVKKEEKFDPKVIEELSENIFEGIVLNYKENVFLNLIKLKSYDEYTFTHQFNVTVLSTLVSLELGLDKDIVKKISFSSLIHDIGKLKIPLKILKASRSLTPQEFEIIKLHPVIGKKIALNSGVIDESILSCILHHHERMNGSGYPEKLRGEDIDLFARIVAVADVYDALTSERPYKSAWNPYEAMSNLIQSVDIFDSKVMNALIRVFGIYPPGTRFLLSNGERCVVIGTKKGKVFRPVVLSDNGEIIDLSKRKDLKIIKVG
ncbi:MAG: HD domain-containing protein [Thermotogae bacterium]|nr:HD domain-containing protein [Thermotogota bacterium]